MKVTIYRVLALFVYLITTVVSENQVRLTGSDSTDEGRVEIFHNGTWWRVCGNPWDYRHATVVCRQLGLGIIANVLNSTLFEEGNGSIWNSDVRCTGYESSLHLCGWGCSSCRQHHQSAAVKCGPYDFPPAKNEHEGNECDTTTLTISADGTDARNASMPCSTFLYVMLAILVAIVLVLVIVVVIQRVKIKGIAADRPTVDASHPNTIPTQDQNGSRLITLCENDAMQNPSFQISGDQFPPGSKPSGTSDAVYNTVGEMRNTHDSVDSRSDEKGAVYNCVYESSQEPPTEKDPKPNRDDYRETNKEGGGEDYQYATY